jgi:hypothetical protein
MLRAGAAHRLGLAAGTWSRWSALLVADRHGRTGGRFVADLIHERTGGWSPNASATV